MSAGPGIDEIVRPEVVVVGGGVAGLSLVLGMVPRRIHLISKGRLSEAGASPLAQGGIASAVGPGDSPTQHAADTLAVSGGLGDPGIVEILTREGPDAIRRLLSLGVQFDRRGDGGYALGREGGHGRSRILHARDATGAEIVRALSAAVAGLGCVRIFEGAFACSLCLDRGRVAGVLVRHPDGRQVLHQACATVLATGGIGRLYSHTTNPRGATGDGLALAWRVGARLVDLEFVQFHPTALAVGADPMPLVTEALRGRGATLVDDAGQRFMTDRGPEAELLPRDIVARVIWERLQAGRRVYLDAREAVGEGFADEFPSVFELCRRHGVDPRREPIPVAPAAHYHMGGIWVDACGRTSVPGLWACGEASSTGAHGANRLASNSLLEAVVFGVRAATELGRDLPAELGPDVSSEALAGLAGRLGGGLVEAQEREPTAAVRKLMWENVGLVRTAESLGRALEGLAAIGRRLPAGDSEIHNLLTVSELVTRSALAREESRGSHFRQDFPEPRPQWQRRLFVEKGAKGDRAAPVPALAAAHCRIEALS